MSKTLAQKCLEAKSLLGVSFLTFSFSLAAFHSSSQIPCSFRFVNCARSDEEQNLVAFQYQGGILYRCCRPIKPGHELLLWYDEEYSKDLSITFNYIWNRKCSINGKSYFMSPVNHNPVPCSLLVPGSLPCDQEPVVFLVILICGISLHRNIFLMFFFLLQE